MRKAFWVASAAAMGALAALVVGEHASATDAATLPAQAASETCRKAEVNPVTGHVLCLDPLGAPVEAPPAATAIRCRADAPQGDGAWTWGPNCKSYTD